MFDTPIEFDRRHSFQGPDSVISWIGVLFSVGILFNVFLTSRVSAASEILARDKALSGTEPEQPEIIAAVPRYWPPQYDIDGEGQADQIVQPLNVEDVPPREDRDNKCLNGAVKEKAAARSGVMPLLGLRSRQRECKTYELCRACDHSQGRRSAQASRRRLLTTFVYRVHFLCVTRDWRAWQIYHQ